MRFRLVEDKSLVVNDKDYEINELGIKQFFDRNGIKYKVKDTKNHYNDYVEPAEDEAEAAADTILNNAHNEENPKEQRRYIAKYDKQLAKQIPDENLKSIYDIIVDYSGNEQFVKFLNTNGSQFTDKPQSLKAIAGVIDKNMSLPLDDVLKDNDFFNDTDANISFKLKAIALMSNEQTRSEWTTRGETQNVLKDENGQWLSANKMTRMLKTIESKKHKQKGRSRARVKAREEAEKQQIEADKKQADKEKQKAYRQEVKQHKKIDSQEEQKLLNKTQGYTGRDILLKLLKKNGVKKPDKQSIYDYTKQLIKQSSMPSMGDSIIKLIDNGDFDNELESVLSQRYKSNLDKDSSKMLNRAIVKALNRGIDKTANPDESK